MDRIVVKQQIELNGRWCLNGVTNQLTDAQGQCASVTLSPIAVRLLEILAGSPNTVIGRRKLFDEGWRRYGFEVCDNSLNQVICALRTLFERLGPDAPSIKTVPRIGYCLVAGVAGREASRLPAAPAAAATGRNVDETSGPHPVVDRQTLDMMAGREWRRAQRNALPLSLLMVSLDTRMGASGDADTVSRLIEKRISGHIHRAGDLAGRYSPTEYAVLLPDTDSQGAAHVAHDIQQSVRARENWSDAGTAPRLTLVVGLACTAQPRYATCSAWMDAAVSALHGALNSSRAQLSTLSCAT